MADIEVENISAEGLPEPGVRKTRTLHRDPLGRFARKPLPHRQAILVGSMDGERVHYSVPDYSAGVPPERKSHDRNTAVQRALNHVMGCPDCVVHGVLSIHGSKENG